MELLSQWIDPYFPVYVDKQTPCTCDIYFKTHHVFGIVAGDTTSFYSLLIYILNYFFCLIGTLSSNWVNLTTHFFFVSFMPKSKRASTPVPTDHDLEKTLRQLKKKQKKKKYSANQGKSTEEPSKSIMPPKSLKSYGESSPDNVPTGPTMPDIQAANF